VVVWLFLDRGVVAGREDPDTQDSPADGSEEDFCTPESADENESTSDAVVVHDPPETLETSLEYDVGFVDLHASGTLDLNLHSVWDIPPSFCKRYTIEDRNLECFCFESPAQNQPVQLGSLTSEINDRRVVSQDGSPSRASQNLCRGRVFRDRHTRVVDDGALLSRSKQSSLDHEVANLGVCLCTRQTYLDLNIVRLETNQLGS